MSSCIKYSMHGFNRKNKANLNGNHFEYTLSDNAPYIYKDHPILESVYIGDHITDITFYLLPGKEAVDYIDEITIELERICFNLISNSELPILQPYCVCEFVINGDGTQVKIYEKIKLWDELFAFKTISAKSLYECGMEYVTDFQENRAMYRELFWILQSPHKVIQFMGLYDIMASLISTPISQRRVHDYFGMNKSKYPFVTFSPSKKDPTKNEDCFTHLRNSIAHSKQVGVTEYLQIAAGVSDNHIKQLLIVINDLLCSKRILDKN